jgi:hypothetical protein
MKWEPSSIQDETQPETSCLVLTVSSLALALLAFLHSVLALGSWSLPTLHLLPAGNWVHLLFSKASVRFLALLLLTAPPWHHFAEPECRNCRTLSQRKWPKRRESWNNLCLQPVPAAQTVAMSCSLQAGGSHGFSYLILSSVRVSSSSSSCPLSHPHQGLLLLLGRHRQVNLCPQRSPASREAQTWLSSCNMGWRWGWESQGQCRRKAMWANVGVKRGLIQVTSWRRCQLGGTSKEK